MSAAPFFVFFFFWVKGKCLVEEEDDVFFGFIDVINGNVWGTFFFCFCCDGFDFTEEATELALLRWEILEREVATDFLERIDLRRGDLDPVDFFDFEEALDTSPMLWRR